MKAYTWLLIMKLTLLLVAEGQGSSDAKSHGLEVQLLQAEMCHAKVYEANGEAGFASPSYHEDTCINLDSMYLSLLQTSVMRNNRSFTKQRKHVPPHARAPAFECDSAHPMCERDMKLFPGLPKTASNADDCERRRVQCTTLQTQKGNWTPEFLHIPKNAGTSVERFLGIDFRGHVSMRSASKRKLWERGDRNFIVVLRHPIERLVSLYSFYKKGEEQDNVTIRQQHFCKQETGKAYGNECVPKYSVYDFIANGHSIYEYHYLTGEFGAHGDSEAVGSEANFMFEWLKPYENSTITDVKEFLMEQFALIGDTAQFHSFLQQLSFMQGDDKEAGVKSTEQIARDQVNPTSHKTVMELFSEDEYALLARRHSLDIELYYWAVQQVRTLVDCFGL